MHGYRSPCATHGRFDVLVNNAGIFKAADFWMVEADFNAVPQTNLKGWFFWQARLLHVKGLNLAAAASSP